MKIKLPFRKDPAPQPSGPQPGDWVTQYAAGYWQIREILPQYADEDVCTDSVRWKKGDRIGSWALLKKGFTPKMKFRMESDLVNLEWCKPADAAVLEQIEAYFREHPEQKAQFDAAPCEPPPAVTTVWLAPAADAEADRIAAALSQLPEAFSYDAFAELAERHGFRAFFCRPGEQGDHLIRLYTSQVEYDAGRNLLYRKPELHKWR